MPPGDTIAIVTDTLDPGRQPHRRVHLPLAAAGLLAILPACSPQPPGASQRWASQDNWLANASFEDGRDPWKSLAPSSPFWRDFSISDTVARSGRHSAKLALDSRQRNDQGTWVWGVVRDLPTDRLPRTLSGSYRVQGWKQGARHQYLQVVVSLTPAPGRGFPVFETGSEAPLQVAWVLGGIDRQPFEIGNRKFVFLGPLEVPQDRWVDFTIDLPAAFQESWGFLPEGFASLRVLFEARYDQWQPDQGEVSGDVFFDDLYLGELPP